MKNKIIVVVLLTVVSVEFLTLSHWLSRCIDFKDEIFHVNIGSLALQIQGENAIDTGPIIISRFFHNKITDFVLLVIKPYLRFWDVLFLGKLFSFVGFFGIFAAAWYFFANKTKRLWQWAIFILLVFLPLVELFLFKVVPFHLRMGMYIVSFGGVSLWGIWKFMFSQKWAPIIIVILIIISIWWLLLGDFNFVNFCVQYP
jgi:hypothetical protein